MENIDGPRMHKKESSRLLSLTVLIVKHRRFILLSTLFAAVLVTLFSLYTLLVPAGSALNPLPNHYTPQVKVRLLESESTSLTSQLQSGALGTLVSLAGGNSASAIGPTNAQLAIALLTGDTLADDVTSHFDFTKLYHIKKDPRARSRHIFLSKLATKYDTKNEILTISYTDVDPEFATKVLRYTVQALQMRFDTLTQGRIIAQRDYLAQRVAQVEKDLRAAQDKLIKFEVTHGIVDIQVQSQAIASQLANLNGQIQAKEVQLKTLERYGRTASDPTVVRVQTDISVLKNLIKELNSGSQDPRVGHIPQDQLPKVSAEYSNLKLDVSTEDTILTAIRQQYESAKLQANATAQTFQIIEHAQVPELKSGPHRSQISILVTLLTFVAAVSVAGFMDYLDRLFAQAKGANAA